MAEVVPLPWFGMANTAYHIALIAAVFWTDMSGEARPTVIDHLGKFACSGMDGAPSDAYTMRKVSQGQTLTRYGSNRIVEPALNLQLRT